MMEFWVNNAQGMPYFFVTGEVNEKLQQAIEEQIVPQLNILTKKTTPQAQPAYDNEPVYTLGFDRAAYSLSSPPSNTATPG
ncbi:MAG: putative transposase, partial [Chlorobiaceae bacterium]